MVFPEMNETTLDILEKLIAFDTVSSKSNLPLIAYVEDFLRQRGFDIIRIPDDTGQKAGLYASIGPPGKGILLSAHTDVVPVEGQSWTTDPFRLTRIGDRLHGRGTCDMKGYLAAMLHAADKAAKTALSAPLKLSISYDEEVGCVGIQHMKQTLAHLIGQPELCIVGEPTEMHVATGHKGKASYRATCLGSEGHSALAPLFANALYMATDLAQTLRNLQIEYADNEHHDDAYEIPYSTVHLGKLNGGNALNIVPKTAHLEFEFRHLVADPIETFEANVIKAAKDISARFQRHASHASIQIEPTAGYPGLDVDADDEGVKLAQKMAMCSQTTKVSFGTEAGIFADLGAPTIVCGPGSMRHQGHQPDEYLEFRQLLDCEAMLDRVVQHIGS